MYHQPLLFSATVLPTTFPSTRLYHIPSIFFTSVISCKTPFSKKYLSLVFPDGSWHIPFSKSEAVTVNSASAPNPSIADNVTIALPEPCAITTALSESTASTDIISGLSDSHKRFLFVASSFTDAVTIYSVSKAEISNSLSASIISVTGVSCDATSSSATSSSATSSSSTSSSATSSSTTSSSITDSSSVKRTVSSFIFCSSADTFKYTLPEQTNNAVIKTPIFFLIFLFPPLFAAIAFSHNQKYVL